MSNAETGLPDFAKIFFDVSFSYALSSRLLSFGIRAGGAGCMSIPTVVPLPLLRYCVYPTSFPDFGPFVTLFPTLLSKGYEENRRVRWGPFGGTHVDNFFTDFELRTSVLAYRCRHKDVTT